MKIGLEYINVLGLAAIGDESFEVPHIPNGMKITMFWYNNAYKIVGRYKYQSFGPGVEQISFINYDSVCNFARLAIDDPERPTQWKILVIDHIVSVLEEKAKKRIEMN